MTAKKHKIVDCPKLWQTLHDQYAADGNKSINVAELVSIASDLEVYDLPLYHMQLPSDWLKDQSMIEVVGHIKMILDADLSKPIIIDKDGYIADGKHRVARALLESRSTIKAVRLKENPYK